MTSRIELVPVNLGIGSRLFGALDDAFRSVGLLPVVAKESDTEAVCEVTRNDGQSAEVKWPPPSEPRGETDSVEIEFSLNGIEDHEILCAVSIYYDPPKVLDIIEISTDVPPFATEYGDCWRDLTLRLISTIDFLNGQVPLAEVECEMEGASWFLFRSGSWSVLPRLPLEEMGQWSLEGFQGWLANGSNPIRNIENAYVLVKSGSSEPIALLRSSPLDGKKLQVSVFETGFETVGHNDELVYRRVCWQARRGFEDIVSKYGEPDLELRPFEPHWYSAPDSEVVTRIGIYYEIDERFVVFFRELRDARVSVTLAGKYIK